MNCQGLVNDFLHDYHAGTLSAVRRVEFEVHLAVCSACRKYVASYKKTVDVAKVSVVEPEGEAPAELVDAILRICRQNP